jgi:hypothetical protein
MEQLFSKTHLDASEGATIKNVLHFQKRTRKVHLNIFASEDQNPQGKS